MLNPGPGEIAALATALSWTVSMMAFEAAGRRIGSLAVNLLRLALGIVFLSLFGLLRRGLWLPTDAALHQWLWLSASGLVGLVLGDLCLFRAFLLVGSRVAALIMAAVPMISALISRLCLGETLGAADLAGMGLTTGGIVLVVGGRTGGGRTDRAAYPVGGLLLAAGGAVGQAVGLVLSKHGMAGYDAFAANQIRLLAGGAGFALIFAATGRWPLLAAAVRHRGGLAFTGLGAFFGPFLGVSLSLYAVQHTQVGVAASLIALVPVLIIVPSVLIKKESVGLRDVAGAAVAVGGAALLLL